MLSDLFGQEADDEQVLSASQDGKTANFRPSNVSAIPKPPAERQMSRFVGLDNQGATCYLNSLIQVMFMTPEFRRGLFEIDPEELGFSLLDIYEQEQQAAKQKGVVEANEEQLQLLKSMGFDERRSRMALVQSNNNVEQAMDMIEDIKEDALKEFERKQAQQGSSTKKKKKKPRVMLLELQRLFTELQTIDRASVSTKDLTSKGFQWQGEEGRVQHDAHELNRLLIDAVEKSLKETSAQSLCDSLYAGRLVNQTLCLDCLNLSERTESFYDLSLQVSHCPSLVSALHRYCEKEVLCGDSAYQCDVCARKTCAFRATKIERLPPLLSLSCNRFHIDKSTNWQRVKVATQSEYPLFICGFSSLLREYDLREFLLSPERLPQSEEEVKALSAALASSSAQTSDEREEENLRAMRGEMRWIEEEREKATRFVQAKLDAFIARSLDEKKTDSDDRGLFAFELSQRDVEEFVAESLASSRGESDSDYLLQSIVVHTGGAHSGHYYAFVRDSLREGNTQVFESADFVRSIAKSLSLSVSGDNKDSGDAKKEGGKKGKNKQKAEKSTAWANGKNTAHATASPSMEKTENHSEVAAGDNLSGEPTSAWSVQKKGVHKEKEKEREDELHYVRATDTESNKRVFFVDKESALGHIVQLFRLRQTKSGKDNPVVLHAQRMNTEIEEITGRGNSWDKLHRGRQGSLWEYLLRHEELFDLHAETNRERAFLKKSVDVQLVSAAEFVRRRREQRENESERHTGSEREREIQSHTPSSAQTQAEAPVAVSLTQEDADAALARQLDEELNGPREPAKKENESKTSKIVVTNGKTHTTNHTVSLPASASVSASVYLKREIESGTDKDGPHHVSVRNEQGETVFFVAQESALGAVLRLFEKEKAKLRNKPNFFLNAGQIATMIEEIVGKKWNGIFASKEGTVSQFVQRYSDFFSVIVREDKRESVYLQSALVYQLVSEADVAQRKREKADRVKRERERAQAALREREMEMEREREKEREREREEEKKLSEAFAASVAVTHAHTAGSELAQSLSVRVWRQSALGQALCVLEQKRASHGENAFVSLSELEKELRWNAQFKEKEGALREFLHTHKAFFIVEEKIDGKRKQGKEKSERVLLRSDAQYELVMREEDTQTHTQTQTNALPTTLALTQTHPSSQVVPHTGTPVSLVCASLEKDAQQRLVCALQIERLLRRVFGAFFEFNDQRISPASFATMQSAFSGRESAYLLLYRRVSSLVEPLSSTQSLKSPQPPRVWCERVKETNAALARERALYDALSRRLTLYILRERDCAFNVPLFTPLKAVRESALCVEVESDATVDALLSLVWERLAACEREGERESWRLSALEVFNGNALFAKNVLSPSSLLRETAVVNGDALLLWHESDTRERVRESALCVGETHRPVALSVTAYRQRATHRRSTVCGEVDCETQTLYVPSSLSLRDALKLVCVRLSLSLSQCEVQCRVPVFQSTASVLAHTTAHAPQVTHNNNGSSEATRVVTLYERGVCVLQSLPHGPRVEEHTCVSALWFLREFFVENYEERGMHASTLRERHAQFAQHSVSLSLSVDETALSLSHSTQDEKEDTLFPQDVRSLATQQRFVRVHKHAKISALKKELLIILFSEGKSESKLDKDTLALIDAIAGKTRLRTGVQYGEGVLSESEQTLEQLSLSDGASLTLEAGSENADSDAVSLTVLVPLLDQRVAIDCSAGWTMRELRDLVGQKALVYEPNWTELEELSVTEARECWRLRTTNWMGEADKICVEKSETGSPLTVRDAGLHSGDTLILEKGRVPLPSSIVLQISLWLGDTVKEATDRSLCLSPLVELQVQLATEINDVYQRIVDAHMLRESTTPLVFTAESVNFVVRELRSDSLPGRVFPADAFSASPNARTQIRKLALKNCRGLVVQMLDKSIVPGAATTGAFKLRLWAQRLVNPQDPAQGKAILSPNWPPLEIVALGPQIGHVVRSVTEAFPDLLASDVCVCVLRTAASPAQAKWAMLHCTSSSGSANNKGKRKQGSDSHITNAPYNLREGDLLCVFSTKEVSAALREHLLSTKAGTMPAATTFAGSKSDAQSVAQWEICTAHDLLLRQQYEEEERSKKQQQEQKKAAAKLAKAGHGKAQKTRVERALVINMDTFDD